MKKNFFSFVVCLGIMLGLFSFKVPDTNNYLATNNDYSLNRNINAYSDLPVKHYYKPDSFVTADEYINEHTFFFQIEVVDTSDEVFNVENVSIKSEGKFLNVVPITNSKSIKSENSNVYTYEVVDLWSGTTYDDLELTVYENKEIPFVPLNTQIQTPQAVVPSNTTLYIIATAMGILLLLLFIIFITFYEAGMFKKANETNN